MRTDENPELVPGFLLRVPHLIATRISMALKQIAYLDLVGYICRMEIKSR